MLFLRGRTPPSFSSPCPLPRSRKQNTRAHCAHTIENISTPTAWEGRCLSALPLFFLQSTSFHPTPPTFWCCPPLLNCPRAHARAREPSPPLCTTGRVRAWHGPSSSLRPPHTIYHTAAACAAPHAHRHTHTHTRQQHNTPCHSFVNSKTFFVGTALPCFLPPQLFFYSQYYSHHPHTLGGTTGSRGNIALSF